MDEPILKTPGELLAEARAAAGLTLAQVAATTKIPVRQLESIERDEFHRLSGPLYVKSFLRAFAEAVGLDAGIVLELYARSGGERPAPTPGVGPDVWAEDQVTISRVGLPWGRLAALAAVAVLVVVVLWLLARTFFGGEAAQLQRSAEPPPAGSEAATGTALGTGPGAEPGTEPGTELGTGSAESLAIDAQLPVVEPADTAATNAGETAAAADRSDGPAVAATDSLARAFGSLSATQIRRAAARSRAADPSVPPDRGGRGAAPVAVQGDEAADLLIGGRAWPLRLRLLAHAPLRIEVRNEAEQERRVTEVPRARRGVPPLPADGVEAGRVYVAREGLVVYWGAEEYFEFRLDGTEGAELTLNGEVCDLGDVGPDQVKMLFRRSLQPGGQR